MNASTEKQDPYSGDEIVSSIQEVHRESVDYWATFFEAGAFFEPLGEAWSPSENVRHLTKTIRAVTLGLKLPKTILLLRFGRPKNKSRSYSEVVEVYRAALAAGGKAGKFTPSAQEPVSDQKAGYEEILGFHKKSVEELCMAIERWNENSLDSRQMPHPLIGNLTVREMLLFTLYHNQHHVENVRRLSGA